MSILPNFESSALSELSENTKSKRKRVELEDGADTETTNGLHSSDENNNEIEKSNKEKFRDYIKGRFSIIQEDSTQKKNFKKQKKAILNSNMTTLEQIYFPELMLESTSKADRFLFKTLYNIQSTNTNSRQRKKYNRRIHFLISKNPDSMFLITEKIIPIILENDFSTSRFHCFKLLSQNLLLLSSDYLLKNSRLLQNIWLTLVYLILAPTRNAGDDTVDAEEQNVSEVLLTESKKVLTAFLQSVAFKDIVSLLKPHLEDETMMDSVAVTLSFCGIDETGVLQFIHLLCKSKSWMHRYIGCKAIFFMLLNETNVVGGHLRDILECIKLVFKDSEQGNRIVASMTLNLLIVKNAGAKKSFQVFEHVILDDLVSQINKSWGKLLALQLRGLASLLPLMDHELITIYGKQVLNVITREMNTNSIDMQVTILISIQRLIEAKTFIDLNEFKEKLFDPFFTMFWTRQVSLAGSKVSTTVLFTTSMIAKKTGIVYVIERLIDHLKDKLESLRVMSVRVIARVLKDSQNAIVTLPENLEERLIDSLLIAFQEQKTETNAFVDCFIILAEKLGKRLELYLLPIISTGLNMMSNKNQILRRNAADLCASMTRICADLDQRDLVIKLGAVFYENLGEPIGDVLQYVVKCLAEVFRYTSDLKELQPPVSQLLPTLTPILKNPHHGVSKNLLDLVSQISRKSSDMIPPREWNRVCNEILEIFKSPIKEIRVRANETFGIIAEGIGPQEIIITLVNNLKMSERQLRLCSSIAMAIVAKSCGTFTILPVLMNEFRTPDTNIKNGILKTLAFIFEYIGEESINYVYHMIPMIEHALTDRNIVLRQTASAAVKSLAISCKSCDREDAFIHFLNLLIPNIFETSPHAIERIRSAVVSLRVTIGTDILMQYIWAGLIHPSTLVRQSYYAVFNIIKSEECERLVPFYPLNQVEELNNVI